jgi:hypothetical protein
MKYKLTKEQLNKLSNFNEDKIIGGLSDGKTVDDIAKKHGVSVEEINSQLEKGIKVEMEHTDDKNLAREISLDHLYELKDYYTRLSKIEESSLWNIDDITPKELSFSQKKGDVDFGKINKVYDYIIHMVELKPQNPKFIPQSLKNYSEEDFKKDLNIVLRYENNFWNKDFMGLSKSDSISAVAAVPSKKLSYIKQKFGSESTIKDYSKNQLNQMKGYKRKPYSDEEIEKELSLKESFFDVEEINPKTKEINWDDVNFHNSLVQIIKKYDDTLGKLLLNQMNTAGGKSILLRTGELQNYLSKFPNEIIYFNINEKTDYSKEKESGLHGWFSRRGGEGSKGWVDCNTCRKDSEGKTKCKPCGREKGEERSKYPACRPTPSACKTKGKGEKWGKKSESIDESSIKVKPEDLKDNKKLDAVKDMLSKDIPVELSEDSFVNNKGELKDFNPEIDIDDVKVAMDLVNEYQRFLSSPLKKTLQWYSDDVINKVINHGVKMGWLNRPSTTQVEWTDKGIEILNNETDIELVEGKKDRCYKIAKRKYDKNSAYRSGSIVRCRKGEIWKNESKEEIKKVIKEKVIESLNPKITKGEFIKLVLNENKNIFNQLPLELKKEGSKFNIENENGQIVTYIIKNGNMETLGINENLKTKIVKGLVTLCMVGGSLTSCDKVNDKLTNRNETSCVITNGKETPKIEYKLTYDILKKPSILNPQRNLEVFYYKNGEIVKGKITEVLSETVKVNGEEISKDKIFSQPSIKPTYGSERKINMFFNRELTKDEEEFIIGNSPNVIAKYVGGSSKSWETNPIKEDEQIINVKVNRDYEMDTYYGDKCMNVGNLSMGFPDGRIDFFGVPIIK